MTPTAVPTLPPPPRAVTFKVRVPGSKKPVLVTEQAYPVVGIVRYSCLGSNLTGVVEIHARYSTDAAQAVGAEMTIGIPGSSLVRRHSQPLAIRGIDLDGTSTIGIDAVTHPDAEARWSLNINRRHRSVSSYPPNATAATARALLTAIGQRWLRRTDRLDLLAAHARHTSPERLADHRRDKVAPAVRSASLELAEVAEHQVLEAELAALAGEEPADPGMLRVWVARIWTTDSDTLTLHGSHDTAATSVADWAREHWDALRVTTPGLDRRISDHDESAISAYFDHAAEHLDNTGYMIYPVDVPDAVPLQAIPA